MHIQLQNMTFYPALGGAETYIFEVAKELLSRGYRVSVLCMNYNESVSEKTELEGVEVIRHKGFSHLGKAWPLSPIVYVTQLKKLVRKNADDVDLIWALNPLYGYACRSAFPDKPVLYQSVTSMVLYRSPFRNKNINIKYKIGKLFQSQLYCYFEKSAIIHSDIVIIWSRMHKKEVCDFYNINTDNIFVVPPGVNLEEYQCRGKDKNLLKNLNIPAGSRVILTVSRLVPEKNIQMLLRAFSLLRSKENYLIIVGDGREKDNLKQLANELNINDNVIFTGGQRNVSRFYCIADVFVLPSIYETFGLVYLEAMASGVPCVGLRPDYPRVIVATEEIIRDNETGFLINPCSEMDLARKIEAILSDYSLRDKMGKKARIVCEQEYSWDSHIENVLKLLDKI